MQTTYQASSSIAREFFKAESMAYYLSSLLVAWLLACMVATAWLAYSVPIDALDLQRASWHWSYSSITFLSGTLGVALSAAVLLTGAVVGFARATWNPALISAFVTAAILAGGHESNILRIGIANGSVKVGCFEESRECLEMLGAHSADAPSMYSGGDKADWYLKRIQVNAPNPLLSLPGAYFLTSPIYAIHSEEINSLLRVQRRAVSKIVKRHG